MKQIANLIRRNSYLQFVSVVTLILSVYIVAHLTGHTLLPIEVHDGLRLAIILPFIFGGALTMVPEAYQGKERHARIFFFVNSKSFGSFMRFWAFMAAVAFVCYAVSLYDSPYKWLFDYVDFAVLIAGYACFIVTAIVMGRLLVRPRN